MRIFLGVDDVVAYLLDSPGIQEKRRICQHRGSHIGEYLLDRDREGDIYRCGFCDLTYRKHTIN